MTGSKSFDMYTNVFINISDISALDLCVAINSDCHHYSNLLGFLYTSSSCFMRSRNYITHGAVGVVLFSFRTPL